jgi:hypothetical protein
VYNPVDTEEALRRQLNSKRSRESADERQLEKVIKLQSAYTHDTTQMRDVKAPSEISGGNELKGFVLKMKSTTERKAIDSHTKEKLEDEQWLSTGLVVRLKQDRKMGKGTIVTVNAGLARINFSGCLVEAHQADLDKVIPRLNSTVVVTGGKMKGKCAKLLHVDLHHKTAEVVTLDDMKENVELQHICKYDP